MLDLAVLCNGPASAQGWITKHDSSTSSRGAAEVVGKRNKVDNEYGRVSKLHPVCNAACTVVGANCHITASAH